jgi:hypothetical protein
MATKKLRPSTPDHKSRLEALGLKLVHDLAGALFILDPAIDELLAVNLDERTIERELKYLEKTRDATGDSAAASASIGLRRAVERVLEVSKAQAVSTELEAALGALETALGIESDTTEARGRCVMTNVIDLAMARAFRGARPTEHVRVQFPDGFAYFEDVGSALGEILNAVRVGQRAFVIDIRPGLPPPPDELEPEHAQ